jgi:AcrR family transcriptional regulator
MPSVPKNRPLPRKSPRQSRSTETVAVIIEATARILEMEGHGGFSTNAVASKAGVSIGTLYQYFPNKDALLGALLARETALLLLRAEAALEASLAEDALSLFIAAAIEHQFKRPRLARILDFEEARLPFDAATQNIQQRVTDVALKILERLDFPVKNEICIAAQDVVAIVKAIVDTAGTKADADPVAVERRVRRAVFGYLALDDTRV